jgi:mRNA interferase MazF
MRRGEIWLASLNPNRGAEIGKIRPVLIVQADFLIAQGDPTLVVLPLTTQVRPSKEPLHVTVPMRGTLEQACQVMPEQPRTLDRRRLIEGPLTRLTNDELRAVERSLKAVLGLDEDIQPWRTEEVSATRAAGYAKASRYEMLEQPAVAGDRPRRMPRADADSGIEVLRAEFRPKAVRLLFVGESSPAGGTHFFLTNSNLFQAIREAFVAKFGSDVPSGADFLPYFRDQGAWLVDLADSPVNWLDERERSSAVTGGIERLASVIADTRPQRIIAVKKSTGDAVRRAAQAARFSGDIVVLPFPLYQWRAIFVKGLVAELLRDPNPRPPSRKRRSRRKTRR